MRTHFVHRAGILASALALISSVMVVRTASAFTPAVPPGCSASITTTFTNSTPVVIPTGPAVVTSTITVTGIDPYLWDLDLQTFLTHTFAGDLDITLQSPAGTIVTLTTDNGSGNDNVFTGTVWDDDANPAGQVPYATNNGLVTDHAYVNLTLASPLVPEEALGAFIGEDPNGNWVITISDDLAGDGGSLDSWSLMLTTIPASPTLNSATFTNNSPTAIPAGPAVVSSTLNVSGAIPFLADVNLITNITHTFAADLDITLQSPAGTIVTLTTDNGIGNDNVFNGTVWDDDANPAGQVPYTTNNGLVTDHAYVDLTLASPLVPEEAMSAFIGENPNGNWIITISDDLAGDGGSLDSWSLNLTMANCLPVTVNQAASQADPTNASPILFTAVFGEPINKATFTAADVTLGGTAGATTVVITETAPNDGTTFEISASGMSVDGTVTASITANTVQDPLGGNNSASTSTDNEVTLVLPATVTGVNSPVADGFYTVGATIPITVTFSKPVTITGAGTPQLTIETGPTDAVADYLAGSGSATLTFTYTVQAGERSPDLDYAGTNALALNGAIIRDAGGFDAILTLPAPAGAGSLAGNKAIVIDTINPVIVAGPNTVPANGAVLTSGINTLTVQFNKDVVHDGGVNAANNPANYLLVEDGPNNIFNTSACGPLPAFGPKPDDIAILVDSVTYDPATFVATLSVNGGVLLPDGRYSLFVCGTTSILDPVGNELNGGADSVIIFTVTTPAPAVVPATGFPVGRETRLPVQPADMAYADLGDLWLEIPQLGVKMPIVGVPQANGTWDVSWLGKNAGWLNGSAFPTWNGNSVLTGHVWNADNSAGPFARLNTLWWGDRIIVHAEGGEYVYEVRSVQQISPGNTAAMLKHEDLQWLTLVTCRAYDQASNTYKYRLLVRAVLIEVK
jgi:LPXTG-site transpeptidase (sortase) family protein